MYKTSDLYLAAYLRSKKHSLKGVSKEGKTIFIFTENDEIDGDVLDYFNDNGMIEPRVFVGMIRDMKTLTFMK